MKDRLTAEIIPWNFIDIGILPRVNGISRMYMRVYLKFTYSKSIDALIPWYNINNIHDRPQKCDLTRRIIYL